MVFRACRAPPGRTRDGPVALEVRPRPDTTAGGRTLLVAAGCATGPSTGSEARSARSNYIHQQQVIANPVTVDSEQRLGQTLLQPARTLGKKDPRSIRIELKIPHEESSKMVGTTRPRISVYVKISKSWTDRDE